MMKKNCELVDIIYKQIIIKPVYTLNKLNTKLIQRTKRTAQKSMNIAVGTAINRTEY